MPFHKNKIVRRNLYDRWNSMKYRCDNPNGISYRNYGGRGIKVCEEWRDFNSFYEWSLANGYSKELQLDRIDNDKGYSPDNCRWVTPKENSYNKPTAVLVDIEGKLFRLEDLSKQTGIKLSTLRSRFRKGDLGNGLIRPVTKA